MQRDAGYIYRVRRKESHQHWLLFKLLKEKTIWGTFVELGKSYFRKIQTLENKKCDNLIGFLTIQESARYFKGDL